VTAEPFPVPRPSTGDSTVSGSVLPPGRIAWGLPDFLLCWLAGGVVANLVALPVAGQRFDQIDPIYKFGVLLPAQQVALLLALLFVSRVKGRRSLRADFGLQVRRADGRALLTGAGLEIVLAASVIPLLALNDGGQERQQLLLDLGRTQGFLPIALFVVGAVVMAPLVEELLYRGLLLRALLRRMGPGPAVFISALVFSAVHFLGGDADALQFLPAIAGLGLVLGVVAVRSGSLSLPILIHAGFNLTTTLLLVSSGGLR
jgi:membrane protease YdiL (CAAX protease family)